MLAPEARTDTNEMVESKTHSVEDHLLAREHMDRVSAVVQAAITGWRIPKDLGSGLWNQNQRLVMMNRWFRLIHPNLSRKFMKQDYYPTDVGCREGA